MQLKRLCQTNSLQINLRNNFGVKKNWANLRRQGLLKCQELMFFKRGVLDCSSLLELVI